MNSTQVYDTLYKKPTSTQRCLGNDLYDTLIALPYKMAESIKAEEQNYYTLCKDEESISPVYHVPSADEKKVYEEFEGKRFHKIHHNEIV